MTAQQIMEHIQFMARFEPAYASKALRWYDKCLPWLGLMPHNTDCEAR